MVSSHDSAEPGPDDFLGFTIVRLAHVLQRRIDAALRAEIGVGVRQFGALAYLAREPGIGSAALARRLLITAQSAGPLVDGLVTLGLVQRDQDAGPGTLKGARLTTAGTAALHRGFATAARLQAEDAALLPTGAAPRINAQLQALLQQLR